MKIAKYLIALCLLWLPFAAQAQFVSNQSTLTTSAMNTQVAPATPAVVVVKSSAGYLTHVSCFNILATPVYIKVFDAASVTLGTTAATYQFMCPGNTAGAGFVISFGAIQHLNAIRIAVTGGISLTDDTSITAASVIVNVGYD